MILTPEQLLFQVKNERAARMQAALLMAKLRIMSDEVFPANRPYGYERNAAIEPIEFKEAA
jgi:hypothetical protein